MKLTEGSTTTAVSEGLWGGREEIQGRCHSFYTDHTSAWQLLEKTRLQVRQTKSLYLHSGEVWLGGGAGRKQSINWKTTMNETWSITTKTWKPRGKKKKVSFCENTVIGYLYVDDSSRLPRLSHSVNCLAVHLSANSWLNLNILWLKWMHQRLKACKVTRFSLSSTSRCTSIPLRLALMYPLGLHLVCFWL